MENWVTWKSLNKPWARVGRTKVSLRKWGRGNCSDTVLSERGEEQATLHPCQCTLGASRCPIEDLTLAAPGSLDVGCHWATTI